MVEIGFNEDEIVPKLHELAPLGGEGDSKSKDIEPKGGLGGGTLIHQVGDIIHPIPNKGRRPLSLRDSRLGAMMST
jgi:hypothetical protein